MNDVAKGFILRTGAQPRILRKRLNLPEAKPNGSNKKVSFQFILEEYKVTQYFGALQAELQLVIFAKEVQRSEVQPESVQIRREGNA